MQENGWFDEQDRETAERINDTLWKAPGLRFTYRVDRPFERNAQRMEPLPIYLANPALSGRTIEDVADEWFAPHRDGKAGRDQVPIAVVSAPMGGGKTISTCLLAAHLKGMHPARHVLWRPATDFGLQQLDFKFFKEFDCVILDGVDEFLWPNPVDRLEGLIRLLSRLVQRGIPTMLSCRDYSSGGAPITVLLRDRLETLAGKSLTVWELAEWDDAALREELRARLVSFGDERSVDMQVRRLAPGLLANPLLFGLALDTLRQYLEGSVDGGASFESRRSLIRTWIESWLRKISEQWDPRISDPIVDGPEVRIEVARNLALFAALSGQDMLTPARIEQSFWTWGPLERLVPGPPPSGTSERFNRCLDNLHLACLMHASESRPGTLAFPHPQILVHLAAERLEAILNGKYNIPGAQIELTALWQDIGELLGCPDASKFDSVAHELHPRALDIGSTFHDTVRYWAEYVREELKPVSRLIDFSNHYNTLHHTLETDAHDRVLATIGAAACIVNAVIDGSGEPDTVPHGVVTVDLGGMRWARIPAGGYLLWGLAGKPGDRHRVPRHHVLDIDVYVTTELISHEIYERFLIATPGVGLPSPLGNGQSWGRHQGARAVFEPRDLMHAPVVGVAPDDARQFCDWFGRQHQEQSEAPLATYLPESLLLRIAVGGKYLRNRWPEGRFEIAGLTHWQYTGDPGLPEDTTHSAPGPAAGSQVVLFGGPQETGGGFPLEAKFFEQAYPALVAEYSAVNPTLTSFRLAFRHRSKRVQLSASVGNGSPAPPGQPGGDAGADADADLLRFIADFLADSYDAYLDVCMDRLGASAAEIHQFNSSLDSWHTLLHSLYRGEMWAGGSGWEAVRQPAVILMSLEIYPFDSDLMEICQDPRSWALDRRRSK